MNVFLIFTGAAGVGLVALPVCSCCPMAGGVGRCIWPTWCGRFFQEGRIRPVPAGGRRWRAAGLVLLGWGGVPWGAATLFGAALLALEIGNHRWEKRLVQGPVPAGAILTLEAPFTSRRRAIPWRALDRRAVRSGSSRGQSRGGTCDVARASGRAGGVAGRSRGGTNSPARSGGRRWGARKWTLRPRTPPRRGRAGNRRGRKTAGPGASASRTTVAGRGGSPGPCGRRISRYPGGRRSAFVWRGDMDLYDLRTFQSIAGLETTLGLSARYAFPQTMCLSTRLSFDEAAAREWAEPRGAETGAAEIPRFVQWLREKGGLAPCRRFSGARQGQALFAGIGQPRPSALRHGGGGGARKRLEIARQDGRGAVSVDGGRRLLVRRAARQHPGSRTMVPKVVGVHAAILGQTGPLQRRGHGAGRNGSRLRGAQRFRHPRARQRPVPAAPAPSGRDGRGGTDLALSARPAARAHFAMLRFWLHRSGRWGCRWSSCATSTCARGRGRPAGVSRSICCGARWRTSREFAIDTLFGVGTYWREF